MIVRIGFGLAAFFWALPALASPVFATEIQTFLGLDAPPSCKLCHRTEEGGDDTVVTPFGRSMQRLGVAGDNDAGALRAALRRADSEGTDSDGDGIPDLDELREGSDPNRVDRVPEGSGGAGGESGFHEQGGSAAFPATPVPSYPLPQTGCAAASGNASRRNEAPFGIAMAALALFVSSARGRRRRWPR